MAIQTTGDMDVQRLVPESPKDFSVAVDPRGPFERDRARVLHSAAFRRLATKTQVHSLGDDQFIRTRLTHSLEVAQIARDIGGRLGCDPNVVDTAGLAHDLGHPPFGHVGEQALDSIAGECGGFESNAQTLRVLTRLEAKIVGADGQSAGLNLTRACLDAIVKYPWGRDNHRDNHRVKYGFYPDDVDVYEWMRVDYPDGRRCLEAQVMDWADDVAYSVHDVEDGIHARHVILEPLRGDHAERAALCRDVAERYSHESPADLEEALIDLLADPIFAPVDRYDGDLRAQVALKRMTSVLTGRFVSTAVTATRKVYGDDPLRRYQADLIVPPQTRAQCALLKGIAFRYVMRSPAAVARYAEQRDVLIALVKTLVTRAPDGLEPIFAAYWRHATDDSGRLRAVIDQVASLTDPGAIAWCRQ